MTRSPSTDDLLSRGRALFDACVRRKDSVVASILAAMSKTWREPIREFFAGAYALGYSHAESELSASKE